MEALAIALLIPLIKKVIDFIRYLKARDWNGVVTQSVVWGAAIVVVVLASKTSFASVFSFNEFTLADVNLWSQVFIGFLLGSSASITQDLFKSLDNHDTQAIPSLLAPPPPKDTNSPDNTVG